MIMFEKEYKESKKKEIITFLGSFFTIDKWVI